MTAEHDLIIGGGLVVDGSGGEPFLGDVVVDGGRITAIDRAEATGAIPPQRSAGRFVDAAGLLVTPGFIDTHSHLDAAATWEHRMVPNSGHGITTTVMGNCGVGFAPCRPEHRAFTIDLMEGVEDIPREVLELGLTWSWESYPDYLDVLAGRSYDMDLAGLVPHSCLRVEAMGLERALSGEPSDPEERATIRSLAVEALRAGAVGIGSTRLIGQRTRDGRPAPSRFADRDEYLALGSAIAEAGHGVLQIAPEFNRYPDVLDELTMLIEVARSTGITITFSLKQTRSEPDGWRRMLDLTAAARADGVDLRPQVLARPTGAILGWETNRHPFSGCPTYAVVADLPLERRYHALADAGIREQILVEATAMGTGFDAVIDSMFPLGAVPDYEPHPDESIGARARAAGSPPLALLYDHYQRDRGCGVVLLTSGNYADGNLDFAVEMLRADGAVPGLGDAGAHCSVICDASATTSTLSYWTRDRTRGERLDVPFVIRRLTADPASLFGFGDRGRLVVGARADINVIDHARLSLATPRMTYDLPGGGKRLVQDAVGYVATIVDGVVVVDHDQPTGALPGRIIRLGR